MIQSFHFDAVILADGSFPTNSIPLDVLQHASCLICCDNAGRECILQGYMPDAIVGDGDSLSNDFKERYAHLYHHESEQEDNDLTKATRFAISLLQGQGIDNPTIAYLGCTGKREDHTLGNISLMVRYMQQMNINPVMLTDYGYFIPASGNMEFSTFPRQQVSIFNYGCSRLQSEGLRWQSYNYSSPWQGTLNEALGDTVNFKADGDYLVYFTYEAKSDI